MPKTHAWPVTIVLQPTALVAQQQISHLDLDWHAYDNQPHEMTLSDQQFASPYGHPQKLRQLTLASSHHSPTQNWQQTNMHREQPMNSRAATKPPYVSTVDMRKTAGANMRTVPAVAKRGPTVSSTPPMKIRHAIAPTTDATPAYKMWHWDSSAAN
jgi:hypothetical protein